MKEEDSSQENLPVLLLMKNLTAGKTRKVIIFPLRLRSLKI